jgi:chorismate mutase
VSTAGADPVLAGLRERVSETDRAIVDLVNARIGLVAEIKRHKTAAGLDFLDPDRERWLVSHLKTTNRGPLSADGVEELVREVLELTKREVARWEGEESGAEAAAG